VVRSFRLLTFLEAPSTFFDFSSALAAAACNTPVVFAISATYSWRGAEVVVGTIHFEHGVLRFAMVGTVLCAV
jgi:hypothetical protein